MNKILKVFWHEYWGNIKRRSYLIFTFGFPLFVTVVPLLGGLLLSLAVWSAMPQPDERPVGVVDEAGLLVDADSPPTTPVEVQLFDSSQSADAALAQGDIQAIYHIQPDYWQSGAVALRYDEAPVLFIDSAVTRWLEQQVRQDVPEELLARLDRGTQIEHVGLESEGSFSTADFAEPIIVYLVIYFVRLAGSFTATFVFDSIASEAHDRTLEILITSVSPGQFITGKLLGLLGVGLTQLAVWGGAFLVFATGLVALTGNNLLVYIFTWEHLGLMVVVLLAAYLMDQILAAAMGLLRVSGGAGNLLFNSVNAVIGISLIYAAYFVPLNPDSPLAVGASLFPLTSPLVLLVRVVVSQVPAWQIVLSVLLLWATNALGIFWLQRLLKTNLLSQRKFGLKTWLVGRWRALRGQAA